jgi:hypothetical protein
MQPFKKSILNSKKRKNPLFGKLFLEYIKIIRSMEMVEEYIKS